MNIYSVREKMIIQYMKEVLDIEVENLYVSETTDADICVEYYIGDTPYHDRFQMSHVVAWVWSKLK